MRALSLFSGIAGFDLAAERCGIEVVAQSEIDSQACKLLAQKFPEALQLGDITKVSEEVLHGLGGIDLVTAGFPCQDLSVAGSRAGLAGARSGLWSEVRRTLAVLRPLWFVGENVPGLLSSWSSDQPTPPGGVFLDSGARQGWPDRVVVEETDDFGTILDSLGELGYGWAYRTLDARYFGVAQRRRRVLIVGCLGDPARAGEVLLEPEGREWHPTAGREAREAGASTLGGGAGERGWAADTDRMTFVPEVAGALRASTRGVDDPDHAGFVASAFVPEVTPTLPSFNGPRGTTTNPQFTDHALVVTPLTGQGNRQDDNESGQLVVVGALTGDPHADRASEEAKLVADTIRSHPRPGSNSAGSVVVTHALSSEGADASEDGTGRGTPLVVGVHANQRGEARTSPLAGSLTGSMSGKQFEGVMVQSAVRRLLPVECSRLQGFPDDWVAGYPDSVAYRLLGNAIAVPVAEWVLRRLADG